MSNEVPDTKEPSPELPVHWTNSSNVLCNYMWEQRFLDSKLIKKAIIPRYNIEDIGYLNLPNYRKIGYPMICFCDIPFSKVDTHMSNYGSYGIGLDKDAVLRKYQIQPIQYINSSSPLAKDFKTAFQTALDQRFEGQAEVLVDYLSSSIMYMKPVWGWKNVEENGEVKQIQYTFQDECEWRYIPSDNFPSDLHLILHPNETTEKGKEKYNTALENHPECWLKFEWDVVRYIIVPDDAAVNSTIQTIRSLKIEDNEKDFLISKIEVSRRFADNM